LKTLMSSAIALAFVLWLAAATPAADLKAQLQSAYDGQCKAGIAKDAAAFQAFFDAKYIATDLDGKQQDLGAIVTGVTSPQPGVAFAACSFVIRSVTANGGTATALVTQTVEGTFAQGTGAPQPFTQIQDSTDTWNVSGTPVEQTSQETGHRLTIAGKVVEEKGVLTAPAAAGP
jgi:hypothetical protein